MRTLFTILTLRRITQTKNRGTTVIRGKWYRVPVLLLFKSTRYQVSKLLSGLGEEREHEPYISTMPFTYLSAYDLFDGETHTKKSKDRRHSRKTLTTALSFCICCYLAPAVAATAVPDEAGVARLRVGDRWLMTLLHNKHKLIPLSTWVLFLLSNNRLPSQDLIY